MEDKDSQQNIDQQVSNSPIDQITKVPKSISGAKVKNPKRVAAGTKLSQYNRKAKQSREAAVKEEEQKNDQENDDDGDNRFFPQTSFTSIIALLGLGLTAIDLFLRYKSQRDDFNNFSKSESIDRDQEINPFKRQKQQSSDEVEVEVENEASKSFGGME